jgi:hypothetical protein
VTIPIGGAVATTTKRERRVQLASDYVPTEGDDVWIRRFKDPSTQIRICPAEGVNEKGEKVYGTDAWPTAREHYDDAAGSFPCDESLGGSMAECDGCQDENERVNKRNRTYYINALDEGGEYRVFKMGSTLYKTFKNREARMRSVDPSNHQPLSDRDYLINRMGKGLQTNYDPEAAEKYEIEFDPERYYDIEAILVARAEQAHAIYSGEEQAVGETKARLDEEDVAPEVDTTPPPRTRIGTARKAAAEPAPAPAKKTAAKRAAPKTAPAPEPEDDAGSQNGVPDFSTADDIDDAETTEIRAWLESNTVEFPARAPRRLLVSMAKEFLAANPPF